MHNYNDFKKVLTIIITVTIIRINLTTYMQ